VPQPSSDESRYSLFERVKFTLLSSIAAGIVWLIGCTLRPIMSHEDPTVQSLDEFQAGIYPFWHRCVLPAIWIFRRRQFTVITSQSRDGEYIARVIRHFGYVPIRGSSSRGGQRGLLEMDTFVKTGGGAAFTIDGPRGPRYVAKKGPVLLARTTGVAITAFYVAVENAWILNTWDAMMIPKPFSRAYIRVARKIFVPPDANDEKLAEAHKEMQAALARVTAHADSQFSSTRD